jgi:BirA family biotin operon repressor/biotin-[acetyl-CoA-carboxylase] ligase
LSVVCRPDAGEKPECLSLRVGLAVARTLETALPALPVVHIKWPNDLYLDEKKLAGVLCEARWDGDRVAWIVCGVGINVRNPIAASLAAAATRLVQYAPDADPVQLAQPVAAAIAHAGRRADSLDPDELAAFQHRDWLQGKKVVSPVLGTAIGVAPDGALLIATPGGHQVRVRAGEIMVQQP